MKTEARLVPLAPIALAAALLAAFLVLFSPLPASAHDALLGSDPAADGEVETLPSALTLTFSAKLIDGEGATEVVVTDPAGESVTDGAATVDGAVVSQPLDAAGAAGRYRVVWKVVSSDGHPTSGEFSFTVATASAPSATPQPSDEPTSAPTTSAPTTAVPSEDAAPESAQTPATTDESGATTAIWIISIIGILAAVAVAVWLSMRARRGGTDTGSEDPTER